MAKFNETMVASLIQHISDGNYPALKNLCQVLNLNLFSCISPSTIQRLESETVTNPNIISEAISLMELCDTLSLFYQDDVDMTFSEVIIQHIGKLRTRIHMAEMPSMNSTVMQEYFTDSKVEKWLCANPLFVGLYIYVFLATIADE